MANRIVILLMAIANLSLAQAISRADYIKKYQDVAVSQMNTYKIPASITLAQGILESQNGNSELSTKSNNHFGIKCHSGWQGEKFYHDDDKKQECFRKYSTVAESYQDHSAFLQKERYSSLFDLSIRDYKSWAKGLKKAGYATNPSYAKLLIKIIEDNDLSSFDGDYDGELNSSVFFGTMYGWNDLLSQQLIYLNDSKRYYVEGVLSVSLSDASLMFGGGLMLTQNIVIGPEFGYSISIKDDSFEYNPKYAIANQFLFGKKLNSWNVKLQLSTYDFVTIVPSLSFGLLK